MSWPVAFVMSIALLGAFASGVIVGAVLVELGRRNREPAEARATPRIEARQH